MIETGDGPAAYYADITQTVITLALPAPPGPPASAAAFPDRLDPGWLEAALAADPSRLAAVTAARRASSTRHSTCSSSTTRTCTKSPSGPPSPQPPRHHRRYHQRRQRQPPALVFGFSTAPRRPTELP